MIIFIDSHGVCDDADDDQGQSTKLMIYYDKQKMYFFNFTISEDSYSTQ